MPLIKRGKIVKINIFIAIYYNIIIAVSSPALYNYNINRNMYSFIHEKCVLTALHFSDVKNKRV